MHHQLLDERNRPWWDDINQHFSTSVIIYEGREYSSHLHDRNAEFFIPLNQVSIEAFTHEVLHIWLRTKNIFVTEFILRRFKEEPLLYWSFTDYLFEQLGLCLEHVKMLPLFINAGFQKEKFAEDYDQPKCGPVHLQIMEAGMTKPTGRIPLPCLDLYVSRFFAIKSCPNEMFCYDHYLDAMKGIRPDLFETLSNFWNQWMSFDINRRDASAYSYKIFTSAFVHELGKWAVRSIHTQKDNRKPHTFCQ